MSIVFMLIVITLPINNLIKTERVKLYDRRTISFYLHDELLQQLDTGRMMETKIYTISINNRDVNFLFTNNNGLLKGCAKWENVKQKNEEFCLYGYRQQ